MVGSLEAGETDSYNIKTLLHGYLPVTVEGSERGQRYKVG